ncbi:9396_t:CDS:1, partial [Gigaspora rosea]
MSASVLRKKLELFENLNSQNNRPPPSSLPNKIPKPTINSTINKINDDKTDSTLKKTTIESSQSQNKSKIAALSSRFKPSDNENKVTPITSRFKPSENENKVAPITSRFKPSENESNVSSITSRFKPSENEKNAVNESISSKAKFAKKSANKTIDTSLSLTSNNEKSLNYQQSSSIRSPSNHSSIKSPVSIEADLLRYKNHQRDDSLSKSTSDYQSEASTFQLRSSDNENSYTASTGMTTPIEASSIEYNKKELESLKKEYES